MNGWTKERRQRQSEQIRNWKPWEKSTGPRTAAGLRRSSQNARKHGLRSAEILQVMKTLSELRKQRLLLFHAAQEATNE